MRRFVPTEDIGGHRVPRDPVAVKSAGASLASSRRAAMVLFTFVAAALTAAPAFAKKGSVKVADLPAWVREAAARPVPAITADLVWLHDEEIIEPLAAGGVRITRRLAAKALKPSGLESLESRALLYRRGDDVVQLDAWTIQPDGTALTANAKDDVSDIPAVDSISVNDDSRARVIRTPAAMVGSVVAFEDVRVEKLDVGAGSFTFGDPDRTTLFSRFTLRVPAGWGREMVPFRAEGLTKEEEGDHVAWSAKTLAPLPPEELRPPEEELMPIVWARWWSPDGSRGYKDWNAVGRWFQELTDATLGDAGEAAQVAARLKPAAPEGLADAIARAFDFAARDVRYVSIQIGIGGYKPHSPAQVCTNRYGDCKDKAFLLRSLSSSWGLKTYPVLARPRETGRIEREIPSPGQFNHCIAAIALPEGVGKDRWPVADVEGVGRVLFLDATVREGTPWDLPPGLQGTNALIVFPGGGRLIQLPVQPSGAGTTRRSLTATVDERGKLVDATLVETFSGSEAISVRGYYAGKSADEMRRDVQRDLQDRFAGTSIVDYRVEGLDRTDAPVVETTKIAGGTLGKRVGDLLILEPGHGGYGVLGVRLPPPPRKWPLRSGRPREEIVEVAITLPAGWRQEDTPPGMKVDSPELTSVSEWKTADGVLSYKRTARLLTAEIPVDRYAPFRESVQKVQGEDALAVVFVKK